MHAERPAPSNGFSADPGPHGRHPGVWALSLCATQHLRVVILRVAV